MIIIPWISKGKLATSPLVLILALVSCTPFSEDNVLDYKTELLELVSNLDHYKCGSYDRDDIDEFIIEDVRSLNIHFIVKNEGCSKNTFSGFFEAKDSLVVFVQESSGLGDVERRIIYDYSQKPRNQGDDEVYAASYKIVQLDERWYYSEVGFD